VDGNRTKDGKSRAHGSQRLSWREASGPVGSSEKSDAISQPAAGKKGRKDRDGKGRTDRSSREQEAEGGPRHFR
jgi:hypothetical protein